MRYVSVLFAILISLPVWAHQGRTDSSGGHTNRKTGQYHKHGGGSSQEKEQDHEKQRDKVQNHEKTAPSYRNRVIPNNAPTKRVWNSVKQEKGIKIASWNIRSFSNNSRDDTELQYIADIISQYDLIAIMELRDEKVLQRLQEMLSLSGKEYDYLFSDKVGKAGSSYHEHYAFFYYRGAVRVLQNGQLYPDTDNKFVRAPYFASFKAGQFDFSMIVVHIVWGDSYRERQSEIQSLDSVYKYVDIQNGAEDDILLSGDFNRNPDDMFAYKTLLALPSMTQLFQMPDSSLVTSDNLYDNIFFLKNTVTEYTGVKGIDIFDKRLFPDAPGQASKFVSDHRPVWAQFRIRNITPALTAPAIGTSEHLMPEPVTVSKAIPDIDDSQTVYVTRTGKKYHRKGCRYLKSSTPISLADAKKRYTACGSCGGGN